MKKLFPFIFLGLFCFKSFAQRFAVSADKNNVFYVGVDNPITVTAENCPCKDLVVKTDNGEVIGSGCQLVYQGKEFGSANIMVYKKTGNKLKEVGRSSFRVKRIPSPIFKIGPYGGSYYNNEGRSAIKVVIENQQYVRADLEGFDFDARYLIDSFSVRIFYSDSCKTKSFFNIKSKISQEILNAFSVLEPGDIIIFNKIYATGPDKQQRQLEPLILTIM